MEGAANDFDRLADTGPFPVTIAEDKMALPACERLDGHGIVNVATMNDELDVANAEFGERLFDRVPLAVRIAQNADFHGGYRPSQIESSQSTPTPIPGKNCDSAGKPFGLDRPQPCQLRHL
jgi:hypothetical protein